MSFKKITFLFFTVLLVLTSCNKSKEISDAIPADANYVLYVNSKSIIEKSDYDLFENPTVKQGINLYKVMLKDEAKIKVFDDFLKNSNSIGLNLKGDFYVYTDYKVYGFVIGVNDATKIRSLIVDMSLAKEEDIKKEGDVYSLSPSSGVSIAWNNDKMILLADISSTYGQGANVSPVNVTELSVAQLQQGTDKSINSNISYTEFAKTRKDISIFYSMKGMADMPAFVALNNNYGMGDIYTPLKSFLTEMNGVSLGYNTSFEKGQIEMNTKYYFDTPEDEAKFKEYTTTVTGALKGDNLKYITSDPLFLASANLKGDEIYKYLDKFGLIAKIKKEASDSIIADKIDGLLKNINGDVTIALMSVKEESAEIVAVEENESTSTDDSFEEKITATVPQCVFFADVNDPASCLSFIKELLLRDEVKFQELTPSTFLLTEQGFNIYLGVHNNTFFVTNIKSIYDNLNVPNLKNNYAELIKGKSSLLLGDIQQIKPYVESQTQFSGFLPFLNEINKYSMTMSSTDFTGEGKIEFVNKDKNSLAVICKQIDSLISMLAASSMGGF